MLGQNAVLDPHYIGGDPCCWSSVTRKTAVDDNVIALRQNKTVLVAQAVGKAADEAEQTLRDPVRCGRCAGCICPTRNADAAS